MNTLGPRYLNRICGACYQRWAEQGMTYQDDTGQWVHVCWKCYQHHLKGRT